MSLFPKMCRLCTSEHAILVNLYPKHDTEVRPPSSTIFNIIEKFTTIKISPTDNLPQQICQNCIKMLNSMLAFQNQCKRSDAELQKMKKNLNEKNIQPTIKIEILDYSDINENVPAPESSKCDVEGSDDENDFEFCHVTNVKTYGSQDRDTDSEQDSVRDTDEPSKIVSGWRMQKVACDICGKLYEKCKLQYHINNHNGLKPFECNETNCNSKFASPQQLSRHKKHCHIDKPNLFCDVCGKGFKVKIGLDMHRSYHFDPELPCTVCEKLFRNSRALKKHMLVHSQERKFPCELCEKSFQTRYTLRIHKRVHTQEKPYSCYCGVSFAYKCLLKTHTEKYHKQTDCLPSA